MVQYIPVKELRTAQHGGLTLGTQPKGAEEGFEARITWPSAFAHADGVVTRITQDQLQYRRQTDNRIITLGLSRRGLHPLVHEGEQINSNQILASVVSVALSFPCSRTASAQDYIRQLSSSSLSERYAASKALSHFVSPETTEALASTVSDTKDHIYVRLEAAASLARRGDSRGLVFIEACLSEPYLENRLETVIVLSEIGTQTASSRLIETLQDTSEHPEIRAGSAWALGEIRDRSALDALVASFAVVEEDIRIEAARALAKLATEFTGEVMERFPVSDSAQQRPGIAWALSKSAKVTVEQLVGALVDDDARRWVAYIIGTQNERDWISQIEALRAREPEVYFAITVLWQIMSSWVYRLEEYG